MKNLFALTLLLFPLLLTGNVALAADQGSLITPPATAQTGTADEPPAPVAPSLEEQLGQIDPIFERRWYQFDVIVFLTPSNQSLDNEQWPVLQEFSALSPTLLINEPEGKQSTFSQPPAEDITIAEALFGAYQPLSEDKAILTTELKHLQRSRQYDVIYHRSWYQPVFDKDHTTPILIQAGERFDEYNQLEGSIGISINRYLHANIHLRLSDYQKQLIYQRPALDSQNTALNPAEAINSRPWSEQLSQMNLIGEQLVPSQTVVFDESRRMRSKELHYIDHPLMGVLIKAMPYEHPQHLHKKDLQQAIQERDKAEAMQQAEAAGN